MMARPGDDSSEGKKRSEFFLVIRPHKAAAELMAECFLSQLSDAMDRIDRLIGD